MSGNLPPTTRLSSSFPSLSASSSSAAETNSPKKRRLNESAKGKTASTTALSSTAVVTAAEGSRPDALKFEFSRWSPITLSPAPISSKIFSYLDRLTLRSSCAQVSRAWRDSAIPAAILQEKALYQALRQKGVIFGPEDWATFFGHPGVVPPLDPRIYKILKSPCPFWNDKRVEETHFLLCLPATIKGVPITFNSLGTLAENPQGGGTATGYSDVLPQVITDHGNTSTGPARWLLITKQIIPGSGGEPFKTQVALLNEHPGYRVAKLGEAVALAFTRFVSSKERLLSNTWTRCEEQSKGFQLVVGGFAQCGLDVDDDDLPYDYVRNGVVGVLTCGSSQASST